MTTITITITRRTRSLGYGCTSHATRDRDIATMLRDAGASDDDAAIAKVRRLYVRRMRREFLAVAS